MSVPNPTRRAVVALGGNAITRPGEAGTVAQDLANLERSLEAVVELLDRGYELLLTHGNGPQVGNQMIRVELTRGKAPHLPLDVMVADLQGGLGYMIERVLRGKLRRRGLPQGVCCMVAMVEVRADDPALADPTKYVGPFYGEAEARALAADHGWVVKRDADRGWRRVVPSPDPIAVVESREVRALLATGNDRHQRRRRRDPGGARRRRRPVGVEGVIDKDLASTVLALAVGATELFILTAVDRVMLDFGTPRARPVATLPVAEARRHLAAGQFPPGSMGPKIEAACRFLEGGGERVLITHIDRLPEALAGETGTWITA